MNLVKTADHGIRGSNYYWVKRQQFNLTEAELHAAGVIDEYAYVDEKLISKLQEANKTLHNHGYELIVKDGYRSPQLYQLVKEKRYSLDGKENTDMTFDPIRMAHATGFTVDVNLISLDTRQELTLWGKEDWPQSAFANFYRSKSDPKSQEYQRLQDLLVNTMLRLGFKLGEKNEFWHFEYPQY